MIRLLPLLLCALAVPAEAQVFDTLRFEGQEFVLADIPGGTFLMGDRSAGSYVDRIGESRDELPVHEVRVSSFGMGVTEVTNAQFELLFPEHRALRGIEGLSVGDDEAVVNVSWDEAVAFCDRLSEATGRHFRLPTEAEWEFACKAGTSTDFWSGNVLPLSEWKHHRTERYKVPVSLEVAQGQPNPWGLRDMHGGVEEWCIDWYGPYGAEPLADPCGPADGDFRVTRGGSHNTPERYLRSVNRSAMLPADRSVMTGFRIVEAAPILLETPERVLPREVFVKPKDEGHAFYSAGLPRPLTESFFAKPVPYVIEPEDPSVPFYRHNHQPAVAPTSDGLLAIWFSCEAESGREMVVLSSRWTPEGGWTPAELFFKVPDRNMTGAALLALPDGRLLHFAGVGDAGEWRNLVIVSRESFDGGRTWSRAALAEPWHRERHQVIAGPIAVEGLSGCGSDGPGGVVCADGTTSGDCCSVDAGCAAGARSAILLACDAGPGGEDGTSLHVSFDGGRTFADCNPAFRAAPIAVSRRDRAASIGPFTDRGGTIAGIHAGVVQLKDGSLMALGRGNSIDGHMPRSISRDGGRTWEYSATPFPPIGSGQRLILRRLTEGPLLLCSFGENGLFAALSYDEGESWPVVKTLTDGSGTVLDGGAWTGTFTLSEGHGEPAGYLAATQTPDGVIHLLSSRVHYRFNLPWLEN